MNKSVQLKFGTPVLVLSVIIGVFVALAGLGMMVFEDIINEIDPSINEALAEINMGNIFVIAGVILMVVAAVGIVAGFKAVYSKNWNLFIAIVHGIIAGFSVISLDFLTVAISGVMMTLTIANIKDANARQAAPFMTSKSPDVATKLKELEALFDQGLISNEEYYKKREDILNNLS